MPSGHTIYLRTHNADGSLIGAAPAASGGKSGHTIWLRTHNPDGTLIGSVAQASTPLTDPTAGGVSSDGTIIVPAATGAKSGATLAARAAAAFSLNIEHYLILFGLGIGSIWVIKHFVLGKHAKAQRVYHVHRRKK